MTQNQEGSKSNKKRNLTDEKPSKSNSNMNTTIHHATQKQRTSNWENHKQEQIKHNPIAQTLHPNASNTYIYKFMNIYSYREPDRERERDFTVEIGGERSGEKDIFRASPRH